MDRQRHKSYAFAASYDLDMGLSFGATYNQADFKSGQGENAKAALIGVKYAQGPIYAAATYAKMENHATFDTVRFDKAVGTELYVSYQLNDSFKVETGYNQLKNDKGDATPAEKDAELNYIPVGVVYTTGPVQLSGTYQFENSTDAKGKDKEDKLVLQARYYF